MIPQDQNLIKLISGRQSTLETAKTNFNDRMQEVADFVAPHREDIRGNLVKGLKKGTKIFDGTAVGAAVLATDGIHGYHVSPAFPWFKYVMNRKKVNDLPEIKEWLEEVEFNMYMALNRSNFYSEAWSWIYDGFTLGTAPMYAEEDIAAGRIVFEAVHPGEAYIQENRYGEVDLMHRKMKRTVRWMVQRFGKENVGESLARMYETAPFFEAEIIHAVFPREEYDNRMKDAKNKKFASVWWIKTGNILAKISGFDAFPAQVWRYMRNGKEPYGVSPANLSMSDIKGLNLMGKTLLGAAQLAVDPAYNVPSYLEGKTQLKPRGMNYVRDPGDRISPVNTASNFPVGIDREQAKQRAIKERFHVDTFLMLAQLEGRGQRTAYEVSEMMAEKAAVLGAELGPLNTELDHLLERVYDIEVAAGRMPRPPDVLLEMAGQDHALRFDPVYMGPLAQAQREKFHKNGIIKFFTEIAGIVQASPEALDNIDTDEAIRQLGDADNVPSSIIRSKDDVDERRKTRQAAQAQQAQMESLGQVAGIAKTGAQADQATGGQLSQAISGMTGDVNGA